MNAREKTLMIVLVGSLGLWGVWYMVSGVLLAPINERHGEIKSLEAEIADAETEELKIMASLRQMEEWKQQSLPPEQLEAATLYKNWLYEEAERAKLKEVVVDRTRLTPTKETYTVIGMSITAKGTLGQVADYLYAIQRADLLQKIRKVTLHTDEHQGDPTLEVSMLIEALALDDADPRDALFPEQRKDAVAAAMQDRTREQYAAVTEQNPFVRGYNGPPPPKTAEKPAEKDPEPEKPGIDTAEHVMLVGFVAKGPHWDATLYDRTTNKYTALRAGTSFDVAGVKGTVVEIGRDYLTMQIDDTIWRLQIGQNLRQIEKIGDADGKSEESPTAAAESESAESATASAK